ncbi:toxic anion resistance protein [Latilactobacillus curvatus]|uniref:Toxic anion resistance protein n=1 Tax=Latilactobacillus curvatus TaxID=28038 RepID=A0A385AEI3_LATCU|nr:toxic anion resistance protein [Latilactobacillus curvatus]AXN36033.1 toxic anion resistance protein [Latilactobacillus curvatus]MCT3525384.1 toxic anion resistance protein [Latilactobacillus curvatus]UTB70273.1 tellurite resistance protein TelA [Latilactobacillus curvatus]UTB74473.1 tellurite resistance protein TelA [Latilactobacillus curvatus]UTY80295.1 tellurite resistance protein TelA [Latilactobacillus curvatus]
MSETPNPTSDLMNDLLKDPFDQSAPVVTEEAAPQAEASIINKLSPEQQAQAEQLAQQLDVNDQQAVLNYGAQAQKKLGAFSQTMLNQVQSQETGEIGDALTSLMYRLNEANPDELRAEDSNVFKRMFGKIKKSVYEITAKYQKIGAQIDGIAVKLDKEKNALMRDNETLETLYAKNKAYFDALNIYIAAGQLKIQELETTTIPEAMERAKNDDNQMVVQEVNDLNQFKNRLEKRTYDLELARQITLQQAPQIRLIQNTNQALAEKIQASINTAIPLWKNQVAIALTLLRQKDAVTAQRQVSETTNDLLKKNSAMLKMSSIETAKENERGVVDIETLQKTQNDLVETLQETLKIQQEGREKRQVAEKELNHMENDLREHLLDYTQGQTTANSGPKEVN